jgi:endonuclease YncB( thermonuclease family)
MWFPSFLVFAALLTSLASSASEDLSGRVFGITDGDTLTVLVNREPVKVRLAEIDTPERGQPWSKRAKQALSEKVYGKIVRVEVGDTDRYGRSIGHVLLDERDINREMVREGHAWAYRKYLRDPSVIRDEELRERTT